MKKKRDAKPVPSTSPVGPRKFWPERILAILERRAGLIVVILVAIATARIVATYPIFNHTVDEPAHIACGMEWLTQGTYHLETQHPPLARVFAAFLPWLDGGRSWGRPGIYNEGAAILYRGMAGYDRTLTLARLGILPFFWLACVVLYCAVRRWCGRATGVLATLIFTMIPPVLAHAGLATTDMALTATLGATLAALLWWAERPSRVSGLTLGLALGLMMLSKFSGLLFLVVCVCAVLVMQYSVSRPSVISVLRRAWALTPTLLLALLTAAVLVWAGYRFSFGYAPQFAFRVPAPELFDGLQVAWKHQTDGHPSYLLGSLNNKGFWLYYPVAFLVKTPIGALVLCGAGLVVAFQRWKLAAYRVPVAILAGLLAVGIYSNINIGIRHLLPAYFVIAFLGAVALESALRTSREGVGSYAYGAAASLLLFVSASVLAHPDYLADFNLFAGDQPERILVDSDLDWGQDMKRLGLRLQELRATEVTFNPFIVAYLEAVHGFPPIYSTDPLQPSPGWTAVSLTVSKLTRLGLTGEVAKRPLWFENMKPVERVGKSVLLYYVPPGQLPAR